jgi:hypothetical protein
MSKYIRLITILLVRFWIWITTLIIFINYEKVNITFNITRKLIINIEIFNFVLLLIIIFISLDIYWLSVIYKNFNKNYKFIKNKLLKNKRK